MITLKNLSAEEYMLPGNAACPGCASVASLRIALKVLGPRTIVTIPACCSSVIQGYYPKSPARVPFLNTAFAATAASASGILAALEIKGREGINVLGWAGDGGTADIGIQALSGAAERNENFIYICYDNEAYMNTGTQGSSATPRGAVTTTTVTGKKEKKKNVPEIMIAHEIPYVATACAAYPLDFAEKIRKALSMKGLKYIHLLSPCPPGWRFPAEKTVEIGKLAVSTGAWILYEWSEGKYTLTGLSKGMTKKSSRKPLKEYLTAQGRFSRLSEEETKALQEDVDTQWDRFNKKLVESGTAPTG
ncbi:MAG: 3-methyl-2-oxobutanoate dehydrogenase subunit beta [Candidatus Methanomethylicaceae archaeon]